MNYCPDINSKDFKKMVEHLGEDLAYHVWDKNGGNSVEYAPNGEKSIMFESLKNELGEKKAYEVAAKTHSKAFKQWFKDSKALDENGQPKVYFHGTPRGGFNEFKEESYFSPTKKWADIYQSPTASSTGKSGRNTEENRMTYSTFLSIKKPFDTRNKAEKDLFNKEFYKYVLNCHIIEHQRVRMIRDIYIKPCERA